MRLVIVAMTLAALLGGCGKNSDNREAQQRLSELPGYKEARIFCAQCHKLPLRDIHVSAAWPNVIARMESYMRANKRKIPSEQERDAIIAYFQSKTN